MNKKRAKNMWILFEKRSSFSMEDGGEVGGAQPEHITHLPYEIKMLTTLLHLKKEKNIY